MSSSLKERAQAAFFARRDRIERNQRGIVTFFDFYFAKVIKRLVGSKAVHGWDADTAAAAGDTRAAAELSWLSRHLADESQGRFVSYAARRADEAMRPVSAIGSMEMIMSSGVTEPMAWKGQPLFKTVFDFAMMPILLWEEKPATIFEIGSGVGASARWMADIVREFGLSAQIHSADHTPVQDPYPGVRFHRGDCTDPRTLFDNELLATAPRPWLVLEDAHVNVGGVLEYFHQHLAVGDYFMIEDSGSKVNELDAFMAAHDAVYAVYAVYAVDTRYTDFFGRNATCAPNSILRRLA